ncbi:MAG: sulfocyanin-like copper-binding protein [Planctomycetaceae bacterium]
MMWHDGYQNAWVWPLIVVIVAAGAGLVAWALLAARARGDDRDQATEVVRRRFAAGEIDEAEFRERMTVLGTGAPERRGSPALPIAVVVAVVLVVMLVVALLAARGTDGRYGPMMWNGYRASTATSTSSCRAPSLPGRTVDVTLTDMRGGGMMTGGGMMGIAADPSTVAPGQVSFLVRNAGVMVHELVVLPLPEGGAGSRTVGADGTVNEDGSLGEASATCADGSGEGIAAGSLGWVTLDLPAGRYELICNLPGHYAAGMFAELDVA